MCVHRIQSRKGPFSDGGNWNGGFQNSASARVVLQDCAAQQQHDWLAKPAKTKASAAIFLLSTVYLAPSIMSSLTVA